MERKYRKGIDFVCLVLFIFILYALRFGLERGGRVGSIDLGVNMTMSMMRKMRKISMK